MDSDPRAALAAAKSALLLFAEKEDELIGHSEDTDARIISLFAKLKDSLSFDEKNIYTRLKVVSDMQKKRLSHVEENTHVLIRTNPTPSASRTKAVNPMKSRDKVRYGFSLNAWLHIALPEVPPCQMIRFWIPRSITPQPHNREATQQPTALLSLASYYITSRIPGKEPIAIWPDTAKFTAPSATPADTDYPTAPTRLQLGGLAINPTSQLLYVTDSANGDIHILSLDDTLHESQGHKSEQAIHSAKKQSFTCREVRNPRTDWGVAIEMLAHISFDGPGDRFALVDNYKDTVHIAPDHMPSVNTREANASGSSSALALQPRAAVFDGLGFLYVADGGNGRVVKYHAETGVYVCAFPPPTNMQAMNPSNIAIDHNGDVLVLSRGGDCVFRYSLEGEYLGSIPIEPTTKAAPNHIVCGYNGTFYVADRMADSVTLYSAQGAVLWKAAMQSPMGLAVDHRGRLYVSHWNHAYVSVW